jgi:hypothetical protein
VRFGEGPKVADEFAVEHCAEFLAWVKANYPRQYGHALPHGVADFCREQTGKALPVIAAAQADTVGVLLTM